MPVSNVLFPAATHLSPSKKAKDRDRLNLNRSVNNSRNISCKPALFVFLSKAYFPEHYGVFFISKIA